MFAVLGALDDDRAGQIVALVQVKQLPEAELALKALCSGRSDPALSRLAELRKLAVRDPADLDRGLAEQRGRAAR